MLMVPWVGSDLHKTHILYIYYSKIVVDLKHSEVIGTALSCVVLQYNYTWQASWRLVHELMDEWQASVATLASVVKHHPVKAAGLQDTAEMDVCLCVVKLVRNWIKLLLYCCIIHTVYTHISPL